MVTSAPRTGDRRRALGKRAEDEAVETLVQHGWQVVGRNVRVGRLELDVLARKGDVLAVVEVRFRGPGSWLGALDSVDGRKRERLRTAARRLWDEQFARDESLRVLRFDVAVVDFDPMGRAHVEHVEGAFH